MAKLGGHPCWLCLVCAFVLGTAVTILVLVLAAALGWSGFL